ncbi:MAG: NAD-dependent epimerase/dehydratase family protein [Solirubrobacterales bacterium]|nr:NAD-dependent epimerase/dehydratase family protein [Solirubrobacterales bacterium]
MRALVTGGCGFIGSNLVDALVARGDEVRVLDNLATGRRANLDGAIAAGAVLVEQSITDRAAVDSLLADFTPDTIFHLGAQIDVRRSVSDPRFDSEVNIGGTINLIESAREHGRPRIVFSSTGGAIYGEAPADQIPTPESFVPKPEAPYGQAKYAAEGYMWLAERLYEQSVVALRYGNVYGPRQDPLGEAGVIAIFCGKLLGGERPTVFGDGTQTRDYVYVDDVVAANIAAAESDVTGPINIGTGRETSVLDLIAALTPYSGADFTPMFEDARLGELPRSALDVSRALELIGWSAKVELSEGLGTTLESARSELS